ncbi:nuclear pore complex protein Nup160-like [Perca fluviatilis]|nr:nuclear pore complex protein Nup160-like [Perca fluviatilis]
MQSASIELMLSLQDAAHSAVIPGSLSPTTGTAWLSLSGEAHYALAAPAGGIVVLSLPPYGTQGSVSVVELKRSSMMRRFSGWMPTAIRGDQSPSDRALSLAVRELEEDCYLRLCQGPAQAARCGPSRSRRSAGGRYVGLHAACKGAEANPGNANGAPGALPNIGLCLCVYLAALRGDSSDAATGHRNQLQPQHISSLFTTQETLGGFLSGPRTDIWGVWWTNPTPPAAKYINFEDNSAGNVPGGSLSGPATASAIVKALQIFRRGSERISDLSWDSLKKEVTVAVETELQSSVTEFEFSQEDYRQLQVEFWSRFYACCLQYQESLSEPLGLTVSPNTHMACLLKKGFVSFLLPCFAVDHLYLSYDEYLFSEEETPLTEDPEVGRDVLQLVQCLRLVSDAVSGEMAYEMEKALEHLQSPERAAELVLENMLSNDSDNVIEDIQNKLQDIRNPLAAMMVLLREMDLETDSEVGGDAHLTPGASVNTRISLSQLYGSSSAVSVVCQAVCHMTMTRALFCRDLLILQKLYLRFGDNNCLNSWWH